MVFSYSKKFIFLHCRKTAGSSIKCFLNKIMGKRDIQIGAWYDAVKNGGKYNTRFLLDILHPRALNKTIEGVASCMTKGGNVYKKLNSAQKLRYKGIFDKPGHERADELKKWAPEKWEKYFSFCFVRNPFERAVSDYIWRVESRNKEVSFLDFLKILQKSNMKDKEGVVPSYVSNWPIYTINDEISVDFIGRYENIEKDMEKISDKIGIKFQAKMLPRSKKIKEYDYKNYYENDKHVYLVEELFEKEIEEFGYGRGM